MNERELRSYLLGQLTPEDGARLEARLLDEQDLFDAMRAAEDDLFDDYARGRLPGDERARFLARYGGQSDRIVFAEALARRAPQAGGAASVHAWTVRRWMPLAAAAALVLVAGGAWLMRERSRSGERGAMAVAPAGQAAPRPADVPPVVALLTLATPRAGGRRPALRVPADATTIEWRVRLDPNDRYDRYAMELRSAADVPVWRADDRRASPEAGGLLLAARMPASAVADGEYELAVRGVPGHGALEDLGFVTIQVTRAR